MLFNISYENFLLHFIDHFEANEILSFSYSIISSQMRNESKNDSNIRETFDVVKSSELFPSIDLITKYIDSEKVGNKINININDYDNFKKEYWDELRIYDERLYLSYIAPILKHRHNIMIISMAYEDIYVQALIEYIYETFKLSCINLNDLFEKGETSIFYLDKDRVHNSSVEIARRSTDKFYMSMQATRDGRMAILGRMDKKGMIKKLKELDINHKGLDKSDMIKLLIENWVEDQDD